MSQDGPLDLLLLTIFCPVILKLSAKSSEVSTEVHGFSTGRGSVRKRPEKTNLCLSSEQPSLF